MATAKQQRIAGELFSRAQHYLDELGVNYVLLIEGSPHLIKNVTICHARGILRDACALQDKIQDEEILAEAERQTAIPGTDREK